MRSSKKSDGGSQLGNQAPGSITLGLGAKSMTLTSGDSGTVAVTITRADVSGDVALTVEHLPTGATASFDPPSVSGNTSTLEVRTTPGVAVGNYDVLIRGLASGAPSASTTLALTVTPPGVPPAFKSVVAGGALSCALTTTGVAYCWGNNRSGQVGNGALSGPVVTPTAVTGGLTFESLTLPGAGVYACGLRGDGSAYCWGGNPSGQLGDGSFDTERPTPTAVGGGLKFVSLSAGGVHTCGLTADSVAHCWGDNTSGTFGDGTVTASTTPVVAAPGLRLESVVAGGLYGCGLTSAGAAYCWGNGMVGQLGSGGNTNTLTPVAVSGGITFSSMTVGILDACGLTATGEAYCWGYNLYGDVGDGTTTQRSVPTPVAGGLHFTALRVGFEHTCGLVAGGTAYCWGYNETGAIGDGTSSHRSTPTPVAGGLKFHSVSIGDFHGCGITKIVGGTNDIYCWGDNRAGQLGDGTTTPSTTPRQVLWPH